MFGRRYRVTEKIGTGGMADVYKAVDEVLGRTVAVKVMHARYAVRPRLRRALPPGGPGRGQPPEPQHRQHVRLGRRRRHLLHRHGVRPRQRPEVDHPGQGRAALQEGRRHRRAGCGRALGRPRLRHHPPRHQAAQHHGAARRLGEGHGLRHRPRRQLDHDADRLGARHRALRLARAGAGQGAHRLRATCTRSASCSTSA